MIAFSVILTFLVILISHFYPKLFPAEKKTEKFRNACEKIEPSIEELCRCLRKILEKSVESKKSENSSKSDADILSKIYFDILQEKLKNGEPVSQRMIQVIRSDLGF